MQEGAQLEGQPLPHVGGGCGIGGPAIAGLQMSGLPTQEGGIWIGWGLTGGVRAGGGLLYGTEKKKNKIYVQSYVFFFIYFVDYVIITINFDSIIPIFELATKYL